MSVKLVLITVTLMPHAITLLGVSPVSAIKDSAEMEELVLVRKNLEVLFNTLHDLSQCVFIIIYSILIADIDECASDIDNCNFNATCTNTHGNFSCACNQGYSGDGVICVGMWSISLNKILF